MSFLPYPGASPPKLVKAVTTNAPAAVGADLYVRVPSMGTSTARLAAGWDPHGTHLPTAGVACLVAVDEDDDWWVIQWKGPWS